MEFNIPNIPFMHKNREFRLSADDVMMVTQRGKEAAESDVYSGSRAQVLIAINDRGSISIRELASCTRLPIDRVKAVSNDLMGRAEIRKVGYDG